jgi:hypothetical protein
MDQMDASENDFRTSGQDQILNHWSRSDYIGSITVRWIGRFGLTSKAVMLDLSRAGNHLMHACVTMRGLVKLATKTDAVFEASTEVFLNRVQFLLKHGTVGEAFEMEYFRAVRIDATCVHRFPCLHFQRVDSRQFKLRNGTSASTISEVISFITTEDAQVRNHAAKLAQEAMERREARAATAVPQDLGGIIGDYASIDTSLDTKKRRPLDEGHGPPKKRSKVANVFEEE